MRYWLAFNLAVVLTPILVRVLAWAVRGSGTSLLSWEEAFFFALFLLASALADVRQHEKENPKAAFGAIFWGLFLAFAVLVLIYGLAAGEGTFGFPATLLLTGWVLYSVGIAATAEFLVVRDLIQMGT